MSSIRTPASEVALVRKITLGLFLGYLVYLFNSGYARLYYDAQVYWDLTGQFYYEYKRFYLLSFSSSLRGYLWPLLLFPFRVAAYLTGIEPLQFARVIGAAMAAVLFGWIGPALWQAVTQSRALDWRRRLAFAALGFVFWRDYFNFTLSDVPALLCLLTALWQLVHRPSSPRWAFLAGLFCMAAVNMRPVYIISAVLLLIGGTTLALQRVDWRALLRPGAAFVVGMVFISTPQLLINMRHFHRFTPLVLAQRSSTGTNSLYLSQLAWGLVLQKYESNLGADYPDARVGFADPVGQRIMDRHEISFTNGVRDYQQYLTAVARNAPDMVALYGRHAFNGMDLKFPTPYVPSVFGSTLPFSLLNYTVLFAALLVLYHRRRQSMTRMQGLVLAVVTGPCLVAIPTAMECRFLMPVHLFLYAVLCFNWPANWRTALLRRPVAVAYGAFILICLMLSANTMWHMTNGPRMLWP